MIVQLPHSVGWHGTVYPKGEVDIPEELATVLISTAVIADVISAGVIVLEPEIPTPPKRPPKISPSI